MERASRQSHILKRHLLERSGRAETHFRKMNNRNGNGYERGQPYSEIKWLRCNGKRKRRDIDRDKTGTKEAQYLVGSKFLGLDELLMTFWPYNLYIPLSFRLKLFHSRSD